MSGVPLEQEKQQKEKENVSTPAAAEVDQVAMWKSKYEEAERKRMEALDIVSDLGLQLQVFAKSAKAGQPQQQQRPA